MRYEGRALVLASVIGAASCSGDQVASEHGDRYAVLAAALDSFAVPRSSTVRIEAQTRPYALGSAFGDSSPLSRSVRDDSAVTPGLFESFERANERPQSLCDCFPAERGVELVPGVTPPDTPGPIAFSGVGFDERRDRALVWALQGCGPMCARSALFLLIRDRGRWVVSRRFLTGTS